MPDHLPERRSGFGAFASELNRRHVTQTALIYVVAGFGVIEFIDIIGPVYDLPMRVESLVIRLVIGGLPIALLLAWLFEVKPDGVRVRARTEGRSASVLAMIGFVVVLATTGAAVVMLPSNAAVAPGDASSAVIGSPGAAPAGTLPVPEIRVLQPSVWAGGEAGTFEARAKQSITVRGQVRYGPGVWQVYANGKRLSLAAMPDGDLIQFSGFVEPPPAGSEGEVVIRVVGSDGVEAAQRYHVRTTAAPEPATGDLSAMSGAARRKRWAVVIGISDYRDQEITDLGYAAEDARAFYDFLRSPAAGMGGWPGDNIELLIDEDATARNIRSALTTFLRRSTPDDLVLLFVVGHGVPDPYRPADFYLLAHDTEIRDLPGTGIPMTDLQSWIQAWFAYNTIVLADVTRSAGVGVGTRYAAGNAINAGFLDHTNKSVGGFVAFTSSHANQLSQEGEQFGGGHGAFTHYLLEGLYGAADEDRDRVVTLGEVMEYTRDGVRRATRNAQIPSISLTTYDQFWPMAAVMK